TLLPSLHHPPHVDGAPVDDDQTEMAADAGVVATVRPQVRPRQQAGEGGRRHPRDRFDDRRRLGTAGAVLGVTIDISMIESLAEDEDLPGSEVAVGLELLLRDLLYLAADRLPVTLQGGHEGEVAGVVKHRGRGQYRTRMAGAKPCRGNLGGVRDSPRGG